MDTEWKESTLEQSSIVTSPISGLGASTTASRVTKLPLGV
jgi:hypothetical protein